MLKSEIEKRLVTTRETLIEAERLNGELARTLKIKEKDMENLKQQLEDSSEQLKQISQSVYTMLQVKYPDRFNQDSDAIGMHKEASDEQRFLLFLHELCACRNYNMDSVSKVFNHLR